MMDKIKNFTISKSGKSKSFQKFNFSDDIFKQISIRIFGNIVNEKILKNFNQRFISNITKEKKLRLYEKIFINLKKKLIISRIDIRLHEFISIFLFLYSIIVFSIFFIIALSIIITYVIGINIPIVYFIIALPIIIILCFIALMAITYAYLNIVIYKVSRNIDANISYAFLYFSIMAAIGVPPYKIFQEISNAEYIYGAVSKESKLIVKDVDLFGSDIITAFKNISKTTPSTNFKKILQGTIVTTVSGGKISDYFLIRSQEFMEERRKNYEEFIETLNMVSEIYITAMVAGPLFLITLLSGLVMAGEMNIPAMQFMVYVYIPLGTLFFIFFIDVISTKVEAN